jgi:hypothetical protein
MNGFQIGTAFGSVLQVLHHHLTLFEVVSNGPTFFLFFPQEFRFTDPGEPFA